MSDNPAEIREVELPPPVVFQLDEEDHEKFWRVVWDRVLQSTADAAKVAASFAAMSEGRTDIITDHLEFFGGPVSAIGGSYLQSGEEIWFIGDIHGDLLGLEAALQTISYRSGTGAHIIFLGDLVDDGFDCVQVITRILSLVVEGTFRVSIIAGNHDEALYYCDDQFKSRVNPGDFSVWLNNNEEWHDLGRGFVNLVETLPRAAFFEQGLFVSHAGFPHSDTWERIKPGGGLKTLEHADMLKDFTWNRLSESKKKQPNRNSSGSTFGSADFDGFRAIAGQALGFELNWMVRGHDHISHELERYSRPLQSRRWAYDGRVLTVNNMCYSLPRETGLDFGKYGLPRRPTLAYWRPEWMYPTPISIEVPEAQLKKYVYRCPKCMRSRPVDNASHVHECGGA